MDGALGGAAQGVRRPAHRPRRPRPAGAGHGRGLWREMPLNQVGTISVPEPRMITVQVWDRGLVSAVEKAIRDGRPRPQPETDGQLVRVPIPQLSQERRTELAKIAHKIRRAGPRRRPQRPPRRHGHAEEDGKGRRDQPGRAQGLGRRGPEADRRPHQEDRRGAGARRKRRSCRSERRCRVLCAARPAVPRRPIHVAIIMDGNGRWAKARGLPRTAGHRAGVEAVRRPSRPPRELGIPLADPVRLLVGELAPAGRAR